MINDLLSSHQTRAYLPGRIQPVFFLWELLGYGTPRELSEKGIKRVWMASFRSSSGGYVEECLSLLRDYKVPISEYDGGTRLRQTLMNFYADMMEMYERG